MPYVVDDFFMRVLFQTNVIIKISIIIHVMRKVTFFFN
nr:MAG TPA: hypothetical protein [Caudoviricetes sp.]